MKYISLILLLFAIGFAFAMIPLPVLHGSGMDGNSAADDETVTVYLQGDPSTTVTDIVGSGNWPQPGKWKIELNNLVSDLVGGEVIVIEIGDSTRLWTVDLSAGSYELNLNLDSSFNDYDGDGEFGDLDCNDNDANINPSAPEICSNQVDDDCDGSINEGCTAPSAPTFAPGGGGGGGGGFVLPATETDTTETQPEGEGQSQDTSSNDNLDADTTDPVEDLAVESDEGFVPPITGAVVGAGDNPWKGYGIMLMLLGLVGMIVLFAMSRRRNSI